MEVGWWCWDNSGERRASWYQRVGVEGLSSNLISLARGIQVRAPAEWVLKIQTVSAKKVVDLLRMG